MDYLVVKWLHVLSSTLLFDTGLGTAWYMFFASVTRDARAAAVVLRYFRLLRIWTVLGFPAFIGLEIVFWLRVAKPA